MPANIKAHPQLKRTACIHCMHMHAAVSKLILGQHTVLRAQIILVSFIICCIVWQKELHLKLRTMNQNNQPYAEGKGYLNLYRMYLGMWVNLENVIPEF